MLFALYISQVPVSNFFKQKTDQLDWCIEVINNYQVN